MSEDPQLAAWQRLTDVPDREISLHAQIRQLEDELHSMQVKRIKKVNKFGAGYEILLMGSGNPLVEEIMKCVNNYELRHLEYDKSDVTDLLIRAGARILELERKGPCFAKRLRRASVEGVIRLMDDEDIRHDDMEFEPSLEPKSSKAWINLLEESEKAFEDWNDHCDNIDKHVRQPRTAVGL